MMSRSAALAKSARRSLPLAAAICSALVASNVHGDADDRLQLDWTAPSGCPRVEDVRARIRKLTGDASSGGALVVAEATVIRKRNGRLHLTLVVRTGESVGQRQIDASACEDLAGATAVNLALLLRSASPLTAAAPRQTSSPGADAMTEQASAPRAAAAPNETKSYASRPANPTPIHAPVEHDQRRWRVLVRLPLAAASVGLLPSPSWGAALAAGVQLERWNILVDGSASLRQSISATNAPDVSAHVDRIELGLRLCHGFSLGRLELAPCARLSLQHIWTRGAGTHITARTAQTSWLAPGIGAQARWSLTTWLGLVVGADAQAQTARPRVMVDGIGRIGQTGPLAITFLVGSEWIL